jgi:predicted aspartyl protease
MGRRMLLAGGVRLFLAAVLTTQASPQSLHRSLPFDLVSNFGVVVKGRIGELDGLRFILDTGSSYSTIDSSVANRLGLDRRPGTVLNFDRSLAIDWAEAPEVQVGPIRAPGIRMMVARLADVSEFAKNADGIIGLDVLSRARKIRIDYERRSVSFELDAGQGRRPVNSFVIPVVVQGVRLHLLVDTGLRYMLLYDDRLREALPQLRTEGDPRNAMLGRLAATLVNLPGVEIFGPGAATPVLLIQGPDKTRLGGMDGYLGTASLHARRIELDFSARTLRWQ